MLQARENVARRVYDNSWRKILSSSLFLERVCGVVRNRTHRNHVRFRSSVKARVNARHFDVSCVRVLPARVRGTRTNTHIYC